MQAPARFPTAHLMMPCSLPVLTLAALLVLIVTRFGSCCTKSAKIWQHPLLEDKAIIKYRLCQVSVIYLKYHSADLRDSCYLQLNQVNVKAFDFHLWHRDIWIQLQLALLAISNDVTNYGYLQITPGCSKEQPAASRTAHGAAAITSPHCQHCQHGGWWLGVCMGMVTWRLPWRQRVPLLSVKVCMQSSTSTPSEFLHVGEVC